MAAQGTPQGTHGAYKGHVRLIVASGHAHGDDETDMRMRAINTLQCACFVAVAVLLAIGGLIAGNLTVALVAAVSGAACVIVKVVLMRAWLRYSAC